MADTLVVDTPLVQDLVDDEGAETATFTRATVATVIVSDGTIDTVASGEARFQGSTHNGTNDWTSHANSDGILIEEARTNLNSRSHQFNAWGNIIQCSISPDSVVCPDGTTSADTMTENSATAQHYIANGISSSSGYAVSSVYAKLASGSRYLQLRAFGVGSGKAYANFDLSDGSIAGEGGSELIDAYTESAGSGWYRCIMIVNQASGSTGHEIQMSNTTTESPSYSGDGTSGFYLWGAQYENGGYPSSYIPTSAATATRNKDELEY